MKSESPWGPFSLGGVAGQQFCRTLPAPDAYEKVPGLKQLTAAGQRGCIAKITNALHFNGLQLQAIGTRFALFQGEPWERPPLLRRAEC